MENMVCSNLTKTYGKKNAVDNVDLVIEKGKIYGLIGRNGAGKTTLLSMMAGHALETSGTVTCDNEKIWENTSAINKICFAREFGNITAQNGMGGIKVKEYLRTASYYYPNWDQKYADELVAKFELDTKKKLMKLSKGMLSMVTIIIALASKAPYTFMDEPVSGLDVVARDLFYRLLLEEYMETGRTFIISTHIIEEASNVFEEVIMMKDGKVILKENTQELLARACTVSGLEETVDKTVDGLKTYHPEKIGRSKSVTVLADDVKSLPTHPDLNITPINLQNLFVAMCGISA